MNHIISKFKTEITGLVIEAVKENRAPWQVEQRPENAPHNPITGIFYTGINQIVLLLVNEGQDPRWVTYYEAKKKNWQVRKGSRGIRVTFWKPLIDLDTEEELGTSIQRIYTVFNALQIDGMESYEAPAPVESKSEATGYYIELIRRELSDSKDSAVFKQLVSELGALFLMSQLGLIYRPVRRDDNEELLSYLRRTPEGIFHAAGTANRLARRLLKS